jgi:hypothetical protein
MHADDRPPSRANHPRRHRLAEAARYFPPSRAGKAVGPQTLKRWITDGVRARTGGRIRLAAERFPSGWLVTDEAIRGFIDALTSDRLGGLGRPTPACPHAVRTAAEYAGCELAECGI